jgi:cystathionine beta-lyase
MTLKPPTRIVNFDACPGDPHRPVATPIYQTATFEQESATEFGAYDYSRSGNPTRTVLEQQLARMENAQRAFCFASGLAAIAAVTRLLQPGDEIVAGDDLYGGTCRLFSKILPHSGISVRYVPDSTLEGFQYAIGPNTRIIYVETPTNPLLRIIDIAALAKIAHAHGILLCVDNSLLSPYLQNPLDLGADIVVHSATKFLCGHSDVTAGVVAVNSPDLADRIYFIQNGEGAVLGPFDSFLLLRGLKTLAIRLDRQQQNAQRIAEFLEQHPLVRRVCYPGLDSHPDRDIHNRQARGFGSVFSFETRSFELSRQVVEAARIFNITVSFGSINSSLSLPSRMSHASVPEELRKKQSVPTDLVRVSVGIEDAEDLITDLEQAFVAASQTVELTADATR